MTYGEHSATTEGTEITEVISPRRAGGRVKPITRREILTDAGRLGGTSVVGLPMGETASEEQPPGRRLKIVVAGGHPGDPEYDC